MAKHPNKLTPLLAAPLLAALGALIFAWIAVHEFGYANHHPHDAALAEVLAWGAIAGTLVAVAVVLHWWDLDERIKEGL